MASRHQFVIVETTSGAERLYQRADAHVYTRWTLVVSDASSEREIAVYGSDFWKAYTVFQPDGSVQCQVLRSAPPVRVISSQQPPTAA